MGEFYRIWNISQKNFKKKQKRTYYLTSNFDQVKDKKKTHTHTHITAYESLSCQLNQQKARNQESEALEAEEIWESIILSVEKKLTSKAWKWL